MQNFTNIDKILNLQISQMSSRDRVQEISINAWRPLSEFHFGFKSQEI